MNQKEIAIFGGGCFWCTEAIFQNLKGVWQVTPGYAGGTLPNPTYEKLLEIFFATHNPTTLNQQGNDVGEEYRSLILFTNSNQEKEAKAYIEKIKSEFSDPIVTEIKPLDQFYSAEDYHQNYYKTNTDQPYCQIVISPKLKKFKEKYPELLK